MTNWQVVTRPMLIDSQRPDYCPCDSEEPPTCPVCPATVSGHDIVNGVCQAKKSGRAPTPLVELITVSRDYDPKFVVCEYCHDSQIELVYAGHGNVFEIPCSMCQNNP